MSRTRAIALALVVLVVGAALSTAALAWHRGDRLYIVHTGSMEPTYQPGDVVLDRPSTAPYRIGDVITFEVAAGVRVTHRLVAVDRQGALHTKGDANRTRDAWALPRDSVVGVVSRGIPFLGYAIVFLRQPAGVLGVMTSALSMVLLWGLCFGAEPAREVEPRGLRLPGQRLPGQRLPGQLGGRARTRRREDVVVGD